MTQIQAPKGWSLYKFEEIIDKDHKYPIGDGDHGQIKPTSYQNNGVPYIRVADIVDNHIEIDELVYISNEIHNSNPKSHLFPDDIIIAKTGATIGKVAIIPNWMKTANTTSSVGKISVNKKFVITKFMYYFIQTSFFKSQMWKVSIKSAQPGFNVKDLKKFTIPVPSVKMQEKIVRKLDYIIGEFEEKKKIVLELQKTDLIKKLIELMKYSVLGVATHGISTKNWKDFRCEKIGAVMKVTSGGTPDRGNSSYWGGNIPWVKSGELLDGDIYETEEHITKNGLDNSSAKLFPAETVLIALYGQGKTRGRTGRLMCEATTNQACCAILPNPSLLDPRYLQLWLRSLYVDMRKQTRTGPQPNWNAAMIKNIKIVIPPLKIQQQIVKQVDDKMKKIESMQTTVNSIRKHREQVSLYLEAMRTRILDDAFSGKFELN